MVIEGGKEEKRSGGTSDRSDGVHHAFEAEGAPVSLLCDRGSEQGFLHRCSHTASEPGARPRNEDLPRGCCESKGRYADCGYDVAGYRNRFAALKFIRVE